MDKDTASDIAVWQSRLNPDAQLLLDVYKRQGMHGGDRRQLIAADGAGEDLLFASGHIKAPSLKMCIRDRA